MISPPKLPCLHPASLLLAGRSVDLVPLDPVGHLAGLWAAIGEDASLWTDIPSGPFADQAEFAARLEAWLVPENFDAEGRQIRPLRAL